ncbi:MAG: hypothetical protein ABL963_04140 [Longimicrobiales bacterium]
MRTQRTWKLGALAAVVAVALTACESENALDTNLITASSVPDQFDFSVNGLDNVTGGVRYFWTVTGPQAQIDMSQTITSGTAIVQIRDGAGDVRYQEDAADGIDTTTVAGASGFWQIDIVLTKVTGGFGFTAVRVPCRARRSGGLAASVAPSPLPCSWRRRSRLDRSPPSSPPRILPPSCSAQRGTSRPTVGGTWLKQSIG